MKDCFVPERRGTLLAIIQVLAVVGPVLAPVLVVGDFSVWLFAGLMVVFATVESTVRPYTTNLLLSLAQQDTGSASSMINFLNTALGVVDMALIMLPFAPL